MAASIVTTILAALASLPTGPTVEPVPAEDITAIRLIDAAIEAYGGHESLSAVDGYRMEGAILTGHSKPPAPTSRLLARPDRFKVVLEYPDRTEVRIVDGAEGWRSGRGGVMDAAKGPMLDSMVLQLGRAALPWILAERRAAARLAPPLDATGFELQGVELTLGEGLSLRAYFDPDTGLVRRALTILDTPAMRIHFETRYSDFRQVDGVRFAFREESYTGGKHTASTTIASIELNPAVPDGEFRP